MIKWLGGNRNNRTSKVLSASTQPLTQKQQQKHDKEQGKSYSLALDKIPCGDPDFPLVPLIICRLIAEITPGINFSSISSSLSTYLHPNL
jgi:hypothetical protein